MGSIRLTAARQPACRNPNRRGAAAAIARLAPTIVCCLHATLYGSSRISGKLGKASLNMAPEFACDGLTFS